MSTIPSPSPNTKMENRRILVIAGSDSSGGAGLEADQKVIAHHHCYAMTATTALTAQNTLGVHQIHPTPPPFLSAQLTAVLTDIGADVIKIGMLASAATVSAVAHHLSALPAARIVLDPVMVATTDAQLLPDDAVGALRGEMLGLAEVVTPNLDEAGLLLGVEVGERGEGVGGMVKVAGLVRGLCGSGKGKGVLLKGGHVPIRKQKQEEGEEEMVVVNIYHDGAKAVVYESDYIDSRNTHGTGCSLASAIACQMVCAPEVGIVEQIRRACEYIEGAIRTSVGWKLGEGSGPINHFHEGGGGGRVRVREFPLEKVAKEGEDDDDGGGR